MSKAMGIIAIGAAQNALKKAVSGLYKPAGVIAFASLPTPSNSNLGFTYTVEDTFTSDNRFTDYDSTTQTGHDFPAGSEVAVIVTGTSDSPVYKYNVMGGIMDGYATITETAQYPISGTVSGDDISATGTADANVQKLTVYGRSNVVEGNIVSIGDSGSITITTSNSDSTASSTATLTTELPFCGIPVNSGETYTDGDGVKWLADSVSTDGVVKRCYKLVLTGDESWSVNPNSITGTSGSKRIYCDVSAPLPKKLLSSEVPSMLCNTLTPSAPGDIYNKDADDVIAAYNYDNGNATRIYIRVNGIATVSDLKVYLNTNPVTIIYILEEPQIASTTSVETSALLNLRTYDPTTNLTITDDPFVDFGYFKNTENGKAVAETEKNLDKKIQSNLSEIEIQAQINDRIYEGVDLTVKFATEIVLQYGGDAWAWIKARTQAGNFTGIHVGDWIPFTTTNNYTFNAQIAGINTYRRSGYSPSVGYHIDFISKELWSGAHYFNPVSYNNGVVPVETITADGETTEFVLTKPMLEIGSIKRGDTTVSGYTYDTETYTITFFTAPAAGDLTVTGVGAEYPWLASDLYLYMNSKSGIVPNSATANPDIARVDYTQDGIYYYLPESLKNVIVEKNAYLAKRYSSAGLLDNDNGIDLVNGIGKLWLPTETEVLGMPICNNNPYSAAGTAVQYPLFAGNMLRVKNTIGASTRSSWWTITAAGNNHENISVMYSRGYVESRAASTTSFRIPICFRVA